MKIKLLMDYCGRETKLLQYYKGDSLEIDQQPAIELIKLGIAMEEEIIEEKPKRKTKEVINVADES